MYLKGVTKTGSWPPPNVKTLASHHLHRLICIWLNLQIITQCQRWESCDLSIRIVSCVPTPVLWSCLRFACPPPPPSWTPPASPYPLHRPLARPTAISCHPRRSPVSHGACHPWGTEPADRRSSEINQVTLVMSTPLSLVCTLCQDSHGCIDVAHPWLGWWLPPVFVIRLLLKTKNILNPESSLFFISCLTFGYKGLHCVSESCSQTHSTPSTTITENVTFLLGSSGCNTSPPPRETCLFKSIVLSWLLILNPALTVLPCCFE